MEKLSPTQLEVMKHAFTAVPEQMGAALQRSAYSPNIKERKDESCALFSPDSNMLAQAEHIPVHLGAMPSALEGALHELDIQRGDQIILNDPYSGGTHLPDVTLIKPVFSKGEHLGFVANRAHHADIGGETPGSMPGDSTSLEEEGIVLSPRFIVKDGEIVQNVLDSFKEARAYDERMGDLKAQVGANDLGGEELRKAVKRFGLERYRLYVDEIMDYSERLTREMIDGIPEGIYRAEGCMEWEEGDDIELSVQVKVKQDSIEFDFQGTGEQVQGNINAPRPVTLSAVYYVVRCLISKDVPLNDGVYRPLKVDIPEGSLLNPEPPAAVSAGNVETSQRVVELLLRGLYPAFPERIPAESQGTMNNLIIGSDDFTYYETIGGGAGASKRGKGEDAVQVHMTNTKNTPIESLENEYPLRVTKYHVRKSSGGEGKHEGGNGIVREIKTLKDAELSIQSERRKISPKGVEGGSDGKCGKNILISGEEKMLASKVTFGLKKDEGVRIETPGGGGWSRKEEDA